ncbi:fungal-specific transcription factor domain-containing protein [Ilyonectria sp. MPI-CAGE-AT-0026]|nr:fungal-specific transcription factor domain-containing protein [Ilyonectria sp. MPI-CAGE-AT-0026]
MYSALVSPKRHRKPDTRKSSSRNDSCRTCKICRQKKIKCDGQRPKCTGCRRRGNDCVYLQDARRTATRIRKEDVRTLRIQIEALQEQIRGQGRFDTAHEAPLEDEDDTALHHVPTTDSIDGDIQQNVDPVSTTYSPKRILSIVSDDESPDSRQGVLSHSTRLASTDAPVVLASLDRASEPVMYHQMLSPEPTPAGDDNEADGFQIYGATSLLHDQSSKTFLANHQSEDVAPSKDAIKDRLVSYAAIRRQEEAALYTSPSLTSKIDFDGVPIDTAMHLLELHWNRQHLSYLLTYRTAIIDSLISNGSYVNKLLLNAIYFQSSLYSDRISLLRQNPQDPQTTGMIFYDRFKSLLGEYIDRPSIPTIVGLLTCGACLVPRGKQSAGWVFCGIAYRMITDLGIHLDLQSTTHTGVNQSGTGFKLSAIDVEMRRRVYWAAYVGDKLQSLFLGRTPAMNDKAGHVSEEYLDTYEEMEEWKPYMDPEAQPFDQHVPAYRGRPCHAISTFRCLLQLCRIISRIIEVFSSANKVEQATKASEASNASLIQSMREIREQLRRYRDKIPPWLQFEPGVDTTPPPHQITPHAIYWSLVILTEHAFLGRDRSLFSPEPGTFKSSAQEESRQKCIEAALHIWKLVEAYKKTFTLRRAQYGISYSTYCAVFVILRYTDQDCEEYIECIGFFWQALLEFQRGCNYGLKRPLRLLKSLMSRIERVTKNINMDSTATTADYPDLSAFQADMDSLFGQQANDTWDGQWDNLLADNTLFGIADDDLLRACV